MPHLLVHTMVSKNQWKITLLFIHVWLVSFGQEYYANTRNIGLTQGLSHYKVLSFYSEPQGMWIGTEDGLNFYDGYKWKYWTKDENQLSNPAVNFIQKDQENILWLFSTKKIGERKNILSIDLLTTENDNIFTIQEKFGDQLPFDLNNIQHFFEDRQQRLFFFVKQQLWQYTPANLFEAIQLPVGFEPHTSLGDGIFAGKLEDRLILVSYEGEVIYRSDFLLNDNRYDIVGTAEQFWVWQDQSVSKSFKRSGANTYTSTLSPFQQKQNQWFSLFYFDEQPGQIWVNQGQNLYLYDNNDNLLYQHEIIPRVISIDHKHNIWIGKFEATVLQLQKKRFKHYLHQRQEKLTSKDLYQCRGIIEKDGQLYVNTYKGIQIINLETAEILPSPEKLNINFGIIKDHQGQIWTAYKELFQLNESGTQVLNHYNRWETHPRIWSLFEDRENRIWTGHIGLSYFENGQIKPFEKYNDFEDLANALILFFYKDRNGIIWLGSNNGLYQLDLKKGIIAGYGKNRKGAFQLPSNKFQHMYQDGQGIFWFTTEDAGLIRWDKARGDIQRFDKHHGMPSNNIYAIYEDDFDNLWMSSFNGIIRFQKETQRIKVYNVEEGVSCNEFNRISHYQAEDGTIYFGSQNGVTAFHPKDFRAEDKEDKKFELTIKHVSVFGKRPLRDTLHDGSKIDLTKLPPGIKVVDLELFSSDLFWTDKINIHYQLQSLDKSKNIINASKEYISSDNHIELFGLTPGIYQLQIKVVQKNGKQLGEIMNIPLTIALPIFHNPIFWCFTFVVLALGIWIYIKFRTARLHRRQEELETMVTERTSQILKDQKTIQTQAKQIATMKDQLSRKDEVWLEQFKAIIDKRLADSDLYLPDVIDDLEISRSVFYEKVKTLTQMTPNQYIQELRLTKAKAILDEGNVKTVKEVSHAVGMNRPSYFSKLFKERFGILPSAYFRDLSN